MWPKNKQKKNVLNKTDLEPILKNKYTFPLSKLKKKRVSVGIMCLGLSNSKRGALTLKNTFLSMGMQSSWKHTLENNFHSVVVHGVKEGKDNWRILFHMFTENSLLLLVILHSFLPSMHLSLFLSLSHIVVLIGVLLVSFHVVPINEWLYPLL